MQVVLNKNLKWIFSTHESFPRVEWLLTLEGSSLNNISLLSEQSGEKIGCGPIQTMDM